MTETSYFPLAYSNGHLDGKLPSVFLADEVGALPDVYALEAMRSGQLTMAGRQEAAERAEELGLE